MGRNDKADPVPEEALPMLRWLRILVTALAVVMGLGMIAVVAIMWLRLSAAPLPELPDDITLPAGANTQAVTFAKDWIVVVTETGEVLLYDRHGKLRDRLQP